MLVSLFESDFRMIKTNKFDDKGKNTEMCPVAMTFSGYDIKYLLDITICNFDTRNEIGRARKL